MNVQYKKGVLELCVLALLSRGDRYGYDVSELLSRKIDISDGSVYPILRKLKAEGLVTAAGRRANTTGSRGWAKRNTGAHAPNGLHLRRRSANC